MTNSFRVRVALLAVLLLCFVAVFAFGATDTAGPSADGDAWREDLAAYLAARGYWSPERWPAEVRFLRREEGDGGGAFLDLETEVVEVRESRSRPDNGIVTFEHRAYNQHDTLVGICKRTALMLKKPE